MRMWRTRMPRRANRLWLRRARRFPRIIRDYSRPVRLDEIQALVRRDDPLILEIGCNDGTDSAALLAAFPRCELHCFECDPRPIQQFRQKIDDPRCHLYPVAVADVNGTATLHMSGGTTVGVHKSDWDLSSSLLEPKEVLRTHPWLTFDRQVDVPTVRLDTWASEHINGRTVDFIWLDVQGAEHLVMLGGRDTFARTRVCLFEFYDIEMYAGQQKLSYILRRDLPNYRLIATYERYNALVVNRRF